MSFSSRRNAALAALAGVAVFLLVHCTDGAGGPEPSPDGGGGPVGDAGGMPSDSGTPIASLPCLPAPEDSVPWERPESSTPGGQGDLYNREAVLPPQCYTRTEGFHNPCYTCHQDAIRGEGRENMANDGLLQGSYELSETAETNHWTNLFVDRSAEVAAISDEAILDWIGQDNYCRLASRLEDADFGGYVPDLANLAVGPGAFDSEGFALDGSGWVAYSYKPLPSTFWPTNGATDDVMIRLPVDFRNDASGSYSRDVYLANLTILEAAIKGLGALDIRAVDEEAIGADLDGDGSLGTATTVQRPEHYVGAASEVDVHTFLYPQGTELLHTVRYIGVRPDGSIYNAPRMKEVRYMRKVTFYSKSTLGAFYDAEYQEKLEGTLPYFADLGDHGLDNGMGWWIQGFIEDEWGELRPNTYEEGFFCMGCHTTIGSTIDKTFSFARKVDGAAGWRYIDLRGMPDAPSWGETEGEILTYLRRVGGGSEFRGNDEMFARWFEGDGTVDEAAVRAAPDVYSLIAPSAERALMLNKAYLVMVREQSFDHGRDPTVTPPVDVFSEVDPASAPTLPVERRFRWDIRLAWPD